jgi:TIR domain
VSADAEESASVPAQRVFISYRRQDSAAYAGRLYDAMVSRFGERNVFMDLDLPPGVDFVERITEAVSTCQVLIEIIGPTWATVRNEAGEVRIADPEDYVRLELGIALRRPDVTVIPVLVSGAQMPDRGDLPPDLGALRRRNALELSDRRWRYDVGQLIVALEELLAGTTAVHDTTSATTGTVTGERSPEAAPTGSVPTRAGPADRPRTSEWLRRHGRLLAGLAALAVVGVILAIVALGGGSGNEGKVALKFERFTGSDAFTVEAPAGWRTTMLDEPVGRVTKTKLEEPEGLATVEIDQEVDRPPEDRMSEAEQARSIEGGYDLITTVPQAVDGRRTQLFWYEHDEGIGPATVATYFFNSGGFGWRTRAAVAQKAADSASTAKAISTRMAKTLEPR